MKTRKRLHDTAFVNKSYIKTVEEPQRKIVCDFCYRT